ncbi:MAG: hypothetical protein KC431_28835 [Myxococcales bacterium]|nr:hypothetical protein [Myxococcales bacterium]MCA9701560.1 hypothetical protein [Myxococcales bacterium]
MKQTQPDTRNPFQDAGARKPGLESIEEHTPSTDRRASMHEQVGRAQAFCLCNCTVTDKP